jgi:hypothetical protein
MYTNIITPTPKNPVNLVNPIQNPSSPARLEIEPKPNRNEPPLQINAPDRTDSEPTADQKRIKSDPNPDQK